MHMMCVCKYFMTVQRCEDTVSLELRYINKIYYSIHVIHRKETQR